MPGQKGKISSDTSVGALSFRIFFAHIVNIIIMLVVGMLAEGAYSLRLDIDDSFTSKAVTAVCLVFYFAYIYLICRRCGERDRNLVAFGRTEYRRFKPLIASLISQIPGVVLAAAMQFRGVSPRIRDYARFFYIDFNYFILKFSDKMPAIYFIPVLFAPAAACFGYALGYRGIFLADILVYRKPKKKG
ncbi:MAG: hypothetical protein K5855_08920 [Oscillospiraceae bacterium]|nr:hypothetical protein [Oscillospiraceae bacterium]